MDKFSLEKLIDFEFTLADDKKSIVEEYCYLAILKNFSEQEAQRMSEILEISHEDTLISFWITEIDHCIGHKLNLINDAECKNHQAKWKEHIITHNITSGKISSTDSKVNDF